MTYPPAVAQPCVECPWRRCAAPGYLGPYSPKKWLEIAHSDSPIACHKTVKDPDMEGNGSWEHPGIHQCRGAAIFRANVHKQPRDPSIAVGPVDADIVFDSNEQFAEFHTSGSPGYGRITRKSDYTKPERRLRDGPPEAASQAP